MARLFQLILAFLVLCSFPACLQEDTDPPTVSDLRLLKGEDFSEDATDGSPLSVPDDLQIKGVFRDEVLLSFFIASLTPENESDMGDGRASQSWYALQDTFFITGDISVATKRWQIPSNLLSGNYTFNLEVIDGEGNLSRVQPVALELINTTPYIIQRSPTTEQVIIDGGDALNIAGEISSGLKLQEVSIQLTGDSAFTWLSIDPGAFSFSIDSTYNTSLADTGRYQMTFKAVDSTGVSASVVTEVLIRP